MNERFVVAIRSNHVVWLQPRERARWNKWRKFDRIFSDGRTEVRWILEIIFGTGGSIQYWIITTDSTTLPPNSTWYIMTKVPGVKYKQVGNSYGLRNWVEYGLKQSKDEQGIADFRMTDYSQIQKWWRVRVVAFWNQKASVALGCDQCLFNGQSSCKSPQSGSDFARHLVR